MTSFSIHTYSTSESSGGQDVSLGHRGRVEQEISPIEEISSSSISDSSSESVESESARPERQVDMSVPSDNAEGVDEVNPPDNDWVITDVRTSFSKYKTSASLRFLLDIQDIVEPSILNGVFALCRCIPSDLVFYGRGS